jgi:L-alanine-DL-glutamate epimerase-like enolase superfamily enzyme
MKIKDVRAFPTSFPIPPANRVALGIGTAVKRDAVVVKVTTDEGLVGWGEAHHGRAHTAVAKLIETTLKHLVLNLDPFDTVASGIGSIASSSRATGWARVPVSR